MKRSPRWSKSSEQSSPVESIMRAHELDNFNLLQFNNDETGENSILRALTPTFDMISICVYIKDDSGKYVYANKPAESAIRMHLIKPSRAIIGSTSPEVFHTTELGRALHRADMSIIRKGKAVYDEPDVNWAGPPDKTTRNTRLPLLSKSKPKAVLVIARVVDHHPDEWDKMRVAIDNANDALWYRDLVRDEIWCTPRWRQMLGLKHTNRKSRIRLHDFLRLMHPEDTERVERIIKDHLANRTELYECIFRLRHGQGHYVWISSRGRAILDASGTPIAFAGSHTDITRQREVSVLHEKLLEINPCLIFLKNKESKFQLVNKTLAHLVGSTPEQLKGRGDEAITTIPDEIENFKRYDKEVIDTKQRRDIEKESITQPNGVTRWLRTTKVPFEHPDGSVDVLGVSMDITDLVNNERAKFHDDVAHSIGHCLKNGVTILESNLTSMEVADGETPATQSMRRAVDFFKQATEMAVRFVTLSGHVPMTLLLSKSLIRLPVALADSSAVTLERQEAMPIIGHEVHLSIMILELIKNAIDFTSNLKGDARIRVGCVRDDDQCLIYVADNGLGVPVDKKEKIFEPFFSTIPGTRTGMGLAYVRKVVELHRGTVAETGAFKKGARFEIRIPIAE